LAKNTGTIVSKYAELWPREVFDFREQKNRLMVEAQELLNRPGVYILYRDDAPYYIGKTEGALYDRIYRHANVPSSKYYRYWNYFSVFMVSSIRHLDDVEGILIAAIPLAANNSKPKFQRIKLPRSIKDLMIRLRRISADALRGKAS